MLKLFKITLSLSLLALSLAASAQNTVLTSSSALPGGGSGIYNVVTGPGNTYPNASSAIGNVFIGYDAGKSITTGDNNSFVGQLAGTSTTTGYRNVFTGNGAGINNTTGFRNVFSGSEAGLNNTTGISNTFSGNEAGYYNTTGRFNVFTGNQAGYKNTSGWGNVFTGNQAGYKNTSGRYNVFTGYEAGYQNTSGDYNVFTGEEAGYSNTTGEYNVFSGALAGLENTSGEENVFTGYEAGYYNTTGDANVFTGSEAGAYNTTGNSNVFVGYEAGNENITGNFNSFFGTSADATGPDIENLQRATALGYNAKVAVNDGLVLGDANVKVGIGTSYPDQKLTIKGNMNFVAYENSLRLKNQPFLHFNEHESLALGLGAEIPDGAEQTLVLGSQSTSVKVPGQADVYALTLSEFADTKTAGQVLTVNESGKVLLTQPRIQVQSTAEWADKVFEENYPLRPLGEVEDFIKKNKHLPGVLSAEEMVKVGVETAAFSAKLLEKIEELTLYSVALEKINKSQQQQIDELRTLVLAVQKAQEKQ